MAERAFLEPDAKRRATAAVRAVEAGTSVELVIAVRRRADRHLVTSIAAGVACAVVVFALMWFSPQVYDIDTMPLDALLGGLLGGLATAFVPGLRRLLTPRARRRAATERAARRAFEELGVAKTRDRTGLLLYVALFERSVVLVADEGLPRSLVEQDFQKAREALEAAVARLDVSAFLEAVAALGPPAAGALPRKPDDENELCDNVA